MPCGNASDIDAVLDHTLIWTMTSLLRQPSVSVPSPIVDPVISGDRHCTTTTNSSRDLLPMCTRISSYLVVNRFSRLFSGKKRAERRLPNDGDSSLNNMSYSFSVQHSQEDTFPGTPCYTLTSVRHRCLRRDSPSGIRLAYGQWCGQA